MTTQGQLFEMSKKEKAAWEKKVKTLTEKTKKLEAEIEEIKANKIYENAFEWRFEFPEVLNGEGDFVGFDVVIGNPPYMQIQKMDFDFGIVKDRYTTYAQTGDLYVLFYERGLEIISEKGLVSYITSNKWLRANYGRSLRKFLCTKAKCLQLIDFNYFQVFDEASVDTNILTFTPGKTSDIKEATLIKKGFELNDIGNYIKENNHVIRNLDAEYWSIISRQKSDLNEKIQSQGKPIKCWNLTINYGIKTGLNAAFIINNDIKKQLIEKDPKNTEIIVPYVRGRDIRRYGINHEGLWLINTHNGLKESGLPPINVKKDYPTIYSFLSTFLPKIKKRRDQGDHWSNLRNCTYLKEIESEKMVYAETMRIHKNDTSNFPRFGYDADSLYCDKTSFIATGEHIKYLLGVLNSNLGNYLIREYVTKLDTGGFMMQKTFVEKIPIKVPTNMQEETIVNGVNQILSLKKQDPSADTSALEAEIDGLVYDLYGLTEEEVGVVEGEG